MNAYVLLVLIGGVIGLLPILWKSKGVTIFFLVCAGSLLSSSLSGTIVNEINNTVRTDNIPLQSIVRGALLLLPAVLGILISKRSVKKKRMIFHVIGAVCAGILAYLWFIRILPYEQMTALDNAIATKQLLRVRDIALAAGTLTGLALLIAERPKPEEAKHGKKHS